MSKTNYGVDIDDIVQKMMISISNLISCITFMLTLTTSTQNYDIESKIGCIIFRLSISLTKWRYRYRRYWQQGSETPQIRHLCKMMREFYDDVMILIRHRRYQHKVWMCRVQMCNVSKATLQKIVHCIVLFSLNKDLQRRCYVVYQQKSIFRTMTQFIQKNGMSVTYPQRQTYIFINNIIMKHYLNSGH